MDAPARLTPDVARGHRRGETSDRSAEAIYFACVDSEHPDGPRRPDRRYLGCSLLLAMSRSHARVQELRFCPAKMRCFGAEGPTIVTLPALSPPKERSVRPAHKQAGGLAPSALAPLRPPSLRKERTALTVKTGWTRRPPEFLNRALACFLKIAPLL
ncbi:hypothetical protein HPB47_025777 [Ixodes persulcatus]|uniref:Uncharacterized protein n=1 Tax=Ixodes persulcatus TaxID=34615 RepID=A0AC60Q0N1_IXOPE|nr:hypothetical protein HPB47_025777 [Ixodes persulcatus]